MGRRIRTGLSAASPAMPAVAVVWFGFHSGGYFPVAQAVVAVALILSCVLRLTLAEEPLAGISPAVVVAAGLLTGLGIWTLASSAWSHTPARALLEFNRLLAYLFAVVAFGSLALRHERLAAAVRFLVLGITIVCGAGLVTRVLPELWTITPKLATDRLSYPLTYWNALGLLAGLGTVLAVHLATSAGEPRVVRVLGTMATPILVATAYLTFSRGGIAAGLLGLVIFLVVGRPAFALGGLLAIVPACVGTLVVALGADALATQHPTSPAGVADGHRLALAVGLALVGGALARAAALRLDDWVAARWERRRPWSPRRRLASAVGAIGAIVIVLAAAGAPAAAQRQYHRFIAGNRTSESDQRARLLDPSNNGRIDRWRVSWHSFAAHPLDGTGAGTYQTVWARKRPVEDPTVDGHSLYLEVIGEMGIVGLVLVVAIVLLLLGGFARLARGRGRGPGAALLAAGVAWALHAGIDWDWEMPAVTWWVFAFGGMALAAPPGRPWLGAPGRLTRVAAALGCLVLAVTPVLVIRSQTRLDTAVRALLANDCPTAIDASLDSAAALSLRPEPFEVLGFCDARLGFGDLAVQAMQRAVARDRDNWDFEYSLALVQASLGRNPHAALRRARALDPRNSLLRKAQDRLAGNDPRQWMRAARTLPLPIV